MTIKNLPEKKRPLKSVLAAVASLLVLFGLSAYASAEISLFEPVVFLEPVGRAFLQYAIPLGVIALIVWLVLNRKNKTPLYYGALWSLIIPAWTLIGLIYALGPFHDLRDGLFKYVGYLVSGPIYLIGYFFNGHTHFLIVLLATVLTGFGIGLVWGLIRTGALKRKTGG